MKKPKLPNLPKAFADNLEAIAAGIHGRPLRTDFAREWKISNADAKNLLEYMDSIGLIAVTWLPEKQALCIVKKDYLIN